MYSIETICELVNGNFVQFATKCTITDLAYDSRRIFLPEHTLFFALTTTHADGHQFIEDAYKKGVRNFIVTNEAAIEVFPASNIILVPDALAALQTLAIYHRKQFSLPVIGITGSNGKTIVKRRSSRCSKS